MGRGLPLDLLPYLRDGGVHGLVGAEHVEEGGVQPGVGCGRDGGHEEEVEPAVEGGAGAGAVVRGSGAVEEALFLEDGDELWLQ